MVEEFDLQYISRYKNVVGIDEVGRGALAGPVVAAAVKIEKWGDWVKKVDDSKKLTPKRRKEALEEILMNAQMAIGMATPTEIDFYNILNATRLAMQRAYQNLGIKAFVLVDGLEMGFDFPHESVVKGDGKSPSIAAASIAAKVFRDEIMKKLSPFFAGYGFERNVGYATHQHLQAIKKMGPTLFHRLTFAPVSESVTPEILKNWESEGKISPQRLRGKTIHLFSN